MNGGGAEAQAERRSAGPRPLRQTALQVAALARRSVNRTLRQPSQLVPSLVFPLFLLAINSAGLGKATEIPGFPTDSYLTFALAIPFIQAGIFSVSNAGSDLARDIETGFLDRLALTPMSGVSLVAGQLAGVLVLGVMQGVLYLVVGLIAGAGFEAGLPGVPVLLALALAISFAFGCIGIFAALRLGNGEAVQGLFPVLFVFLFLSSMALPRDLIEQDWFQTVATYNPVSYLIEGVRSLFVDGFDGQALALGFGFSLAIGLAFLAAASATLRTRLTRT
ncbi:MAG: ABC transporter permease [Actinomycetota bacterium]|nr:ABC transporter permease [Actinomycetota bacterium]MDQ3720838.1 ABC transporter permease [Actinomycetota bacterium]